MNAEELEEMLPMSAKKTNPVRMGARVKGGKSAHLRPIGVIRSSFKTRGKAPKQSSQGVPDAWLEVSSLASSGFDGLMAAEIIVLTGRGAMS